MNKNLLLAAAFASGLVVDVFNNMLGFHTLTCTLIALLRIVFVDRILTKDDPVVIETPSIFSVGVQQYVGYLSVLLTVYNLIYFSLVVFDIRQWWRVLLLTLFSTIVSLLLCLLYQLIFVTDKERNKSKTSA